MATTFAAQYVYYEYLKMRHFDFEAVPFFFAANEQLGKILEIHFYTLINQWNENRKANH